MNTLKIIGTMKPAPAPPSSSDASGLVQDKGGGEGAPKRQATSKEQVGGKGGKAGGKERQALKFVKDGFQASKKELLHELDRADRGGGSKEGKTEGRSVGAASVAVAGAGVDGVGGGGGGVQKSKGKKKKGAK